MADARAADQPTIVIEPQRTAARVVIPIGADPELVTVSMLLSLARERGVEVGSKGEEVLRRLSERFRAERAPLNEVFAEATPPRHGIDSSIEWQPGFDPSHAGEAAGPSDPSSGRIDFYARTSFIRVHREDHVATILPATEGLDGRDVCGRTLAASAGKPLTIEVDASLARLDDGRVIAQLDGQLSFDGRRIVVNPVLDVQGTVDFSTGNIAFEGDVVIRHDIRDRFRVRATKSVTVEGLVDASHIECGGDLTARRGVAGRAEGTIEVGGSAHIGYLDEVSGHIGKDLLCAREIMRCHLFVGGNLVSDLGAIIGGCVTVAGDVRVADLGSGGDTPTELRLTKEPDIDSPEGKAAAEVRALHAQVATMEKELATLRSSATARTPTAAERMTELEFEIADMQARLKALGFTDPAVEEAGLAGLCTSTLTVSRMVHARVTLRLGHHLIVFNDPVKGPIRIWLEGTRDAMYQLGEGTPRSLRDMPGVMDRAAA
ncbi:MAG: DUF342 domain-containing protein [Phycisphaerales bacterium]|nr:DUF342 domain-containing protein [Phycisphaerales bacterium]